MSRLSVVAKRSIASELEAIYRRSGGLNPPEVVRWAKANPGSALYGRFEWDDSKAGYQYRLWQARELITEVEVVYPDGVARQVYVSPVQERGAKGYAALVDVLSESKRRRLFLAQALAEYERVGEKYRDLVELAEVRGAVKRASDKARRGARKAA
jgi:hypothetical protein